MRRETMPLSDSLDLLLIKIDLLLLCARFDLAHTLAQKALLKNPLSVPCLYYAGLCEIFRRNYTEAASYFEKALQINADYYQASKFLADCYIELERSREALAILEAQIKKYSSDPQMEKHLSFVRSTRAALVTSCPEVQICSSCCADASCQTSRERSCPVVSFDRPFPLVH